MSSTWFPPGWVVDVENPGLGTMSVAALAHPHTGKPLVIKDWSTELHGAGIGTFLNQITTRAFDNDTASPPDNTTLPPFVTPKAARDLLPAMQHATVLATAGGERFERIFPDPGEAPPRPLCVRCDLGTYSSPGALPSKECDQHSHRAFGWDPDLRWASVQDLYRIRRQRFDAEHEWETLMARHRAELAKRTNR